MNNPLVTMSLRFGSIWFARSVLGMGIIGTLLVSVAVGVILAKLNS